MLMKRNILMQYFMNIRGKLVSLKKQELQKYIERHDYQQILAVQDKEDYKSVQVFREYFEKFIQ